MTITFICVVFNVADQFLTSDIIMVEEDDGDSSMQQQPQQQQQQESADLTSYNLSDVCKY